VCESYIYCYYFTCLRKKLCFPIDKNVKLKEENRRVLEEFVRMMEEKNATERCGCLA